MFLLDTLHQLQQTIFFYSYNVLSTTFDKPIAYYPIFESFEKANWTL